ncbi:amino acid/polyamine transporter I [Bipolaris maydis]|nr:amino acid/polyamine transporter I [Bipolaris maydis]KAJ6191841.1 amino acid/polyamine transporter I [Bipolaris maydis]KAJ6192239.1 amino acid/polyamine transporter I [Bipolaris maydis]
MTQDQRDMRLMGIKQTLKRNFTFEALVGFGVLLGNTWIYSLIGMALSLLNGGPAGGIWMLCVVLCGMLAVTLCIAEQASVYPSSGGPYVWTRIYLSQPWDKRISYIVGWLTSLGWQAGMAGTSFLTGEQIRGLIALTSPSYKPVPMHSTLLSIAIVTFSATWNTLFAKKLPHIEGFLLFLYIIGFIAFMSVLIVMGPESDPEEVFFEFKNPSGWENKILSVIAGIIGPISTMGSGDAATHLAEEVINASKAQPNAMIISYLISGLTALSMTIVMYLRQGNDYTALIDTPYGQPWIQMVVDATGSKKIAAAMVGLVCVLLQAGCINQTTTTSRQTFAFARDGGLPFSDLLSSVRNEIPLCSVILTWFFTILMGCIPLFSPIAFNVIVSLSMISLYSAYLTILICSGWFILSGGHPPSGKFSLGRARGPVYVIAIGYLLFAIVCLCFPSGPKPSLREMNWSSAMFLSTILFSLLYYFFNGRHHFNPGGKHRRESIALIMNPGQKKELESPNV